MAWDGVTMWLSAAAMAPAAATFGVAGLGLALLGGPLGPSLGFGALLQQLQRLWQEKLFLGQLESLLSAYLPSFDCGGIAQWIEHSRLRVLQPKTLATSPKGS